LRLKSQVPGSKFQEKPQTSNFKPDKRNLKHQTSNLTFLFGHWTLGFGLFLPSGHFRVFLKGGNPEDYKGEGRGLSKRE
jgi:hypothetical protein